MLKKIINTHILLATLTCFTSTYLAAQITKVQIQNSIINAANYAQNVLLSPSGKSQCDYNINTGKWEVYEPAWHTGQIIQALLSAYQTTGKKNYLNKAIQAGNWWKSLAIKSGPLKGFMAALHEGDVKDPLINFTTIADGTPGLFLLSKITGDTSYAATATAAGNWAINNLYLPKEQLLYDIIDVKSGEIWKDKSPHYNESNLPLTLLARPNNEGYMFGDMFRYSNNPLHKEVFKNLSDGLVAKQSNNGFWMDFHPNNLEQKKIHPRFNIWNAESLLNAFQLFGDSSYLFAALNTARSIKKWEQKDGAIYYTNRPDGSFDKSSVCGSAVAFAGILWLQLKQFGYAEFDSNIEQCVGFIVNNQFPTNHPDKNLRGAFFETWQKVETGKTKILVRDIATSFGIRFLCAYLKQIK